MKKILFIAFAALYIISCKEVSTNAAGTEKKSSTGKSSDGVLVPALDSTKLTTIDWLDSTFLDKGKMNEGEKLQVSFRFKNTGDKPLTIYRAWGSCGCTVPETPQKPFAPGEEGVIKASFDSRGRTGNQAKEIYVNANTKPSETSVLTFIVEVVKS